MLSGTVYIMAVDKVALIAYRIEKARETILAAKLLMENNLLSHAENRIYYSIFYLISALAIKHDFSTSKHRELLGWFNKNFVYTQKVSVEMKNIYRDAFENRQESDYEDYKTFEIEEVKTHFDRMLTFVDEIEKLVIGKET